MASWPAASEPNLFDSWSLIGLLLGDGVFRDNCGWKGTGKKPIVSPVWSLNPWLLGYCKNLFAPWGSVCAPLARIMYNINVHSTVHFVHASPTLGSEFYGCTSSSHQIQHRGSMCTASALGEVVFPSPKIPNLGRRFPNIKLRLVVKIIRWTHVAL